MRSSQRSVGGADLDGTAGDTCAAHMQEAVRMLDCNCMLCSRSDVPIDEDEDDGVVVVGGNDDDDHAENKNHAKNGTPLSRGRRSTGPWGRFVGMVDRVRDGIKACTCASIRLRELFHNARRTREAATRGRAGDLAGGLNHVLEL